MKAVTTCVKRSHICSFPAFSSKSLRIAKTFYLVVSKFVCEFFKILCWGKCTNTLSELDCLCSSIHQQKIIHVNSHKEQRNLPCSQLCPDHHPWQNAVFTWFFNQRPPSLGGILFKYFSIYVNYVLII